MIGDHDHNAFHGRGEGLIFGESGQDPPMHSKSRGTIGRVSPYTCSVSFFFPFFLNLESESSNVNP